MAFAPNPALLRKRTTKVLDPLTLGERHARRGQHEQAVQQLTLYLDRAGREDAYAYAVRGTSAQALGNHVRASYDLSMAIRLEPSNPAHYTARGISFAALGQIETLPGALHDHDSAIKLVLNDMTLPLTLRASTYMERGKAREQAGRLDVAVDDLSVALEALLSGGQSAEASEALSEALALRGSCYRRLGRLDEALVDLRAAAEGEPDVAAYHVELAAVLRVTKEVVEAEAELESAVELRPDDAPMRVAHATALWECGRVRDAADDLRVAITLAPGEPSIHLAQAEHLHRVALVTRGPAQRACLESAAEAFGDAERIANVKRDASVHRATRLGDEERSIAKKGKPLPLVSQGDKSQCERAAASFAHVAAEAAHGGGLALLALGRIEEAEERFEAALQLSPDRAETRLQHAMAFFALDKQLQALVEFEACMQLRPGWAAPYRLRGEMRRERGELQEAVDDFTAAMDAADGTIDDRMRRGGVRMLLGQAHGAIEDFTAALSVGMPAGPPTVKLHIAYAAALRAAGKRKRALRELGTALRHARSQLSLPYPHLPLDALESEGAASPGDEEDDEEEGGAPPDKLAQATFERRENERMRAEHDGLLGAVHSMRGQCLHELGQFGGAVRAFDQSLKHNPKDGLTLAMRAASNFRCESLPAALSDVRAALAPGSLPDAANDLRAGSQQLLGVILARCDHPWGALAALSACVHLQRDTVEQLLAAADAPPAPAARRAAPGRPSAPGHRAAPTMAPAAAAPTAAPTRTLQLPRTQRQQHRPAPTMNKAPPSQPAARRAPPPVGHHRPAPTGADGRRSKRTTRALEQPRVPPAAGYALLQRGLVLLLCDRFEAAVDDLSLALRLHPGWARAHYLRGFAHKARGHFDHAAADFEAASLEVKVDYRHVHHVTLEPEAILEEAGWQPLPTCLHLALEEQDDDGGDADDEEVDHLAPPSWSRAADEGTLEDEGAADDDDDDDDDDVDDDDEDADEDEDEGEEEHPTLWSLR